MEKVKPNKLSEKGATKPCVALCGHCSLGHYTELHDGHKLICEAADEPIEELAECPIGL